MASEDQVVSVDHLVVLAAEALEASAEEVPLVAVAPAEEFNQKPKIKEKIPIKRI